MKSVMKVFAVMMLAGVLAACTAKPVASKEMSEKRSVAQVGAGSGGSGDIDSGDVSTSNGGLSAKIGTLKNADHTAPIGRIIKVHNVLVQNDPNPRLNVSVVIEDRGGSTDMSPSLRAYLSLYQKGEMFSTDASFDLGGFFQVKSVKRVGAGIYELKASYGDHTRDEGGYVQEGTFRIDASKAVNDMLAVRCPSDMDCSASEDFKSTVTVTKKK